MSDIYKIAAVQTNVTFADKQANLNLVCELIEKAAGSAANLIVFPECMLTGYCFESVEEAEPLAEEIPGPSCTALAETCSKYQVHTVCGMLERDGDRLYNACVLIGPGGLVSCYRKVHLPYLGIDRFTTAGDRFAVDQANGLRIGMNICYDGGFPESARVMALAGADLIVLPTNWPPGAETMAEYCVNARAMENHVYYMAVNRVGNERGFRFIGNSRICAPSGETMAAADGESEQILFAEIDAGVARSKKIVRVPGKHVIDRFGDRRPEVYGSITDAVR